MILRVLPGLLSEGGSTADCGGELDDRLATRGDEHVALHRCAAGRRDLDRVTAGRELDARDALGERHVLLAVDHDLAGLLCRLDDHDADRVAAEPLDDARRDLAERVVVRVLQVVGVGLLEDRVRLALLVEVDLRGDLALRRPLGDEAPDVALGLDLLGDLLLALGRRPRRALHRGGEHAERLRRLDERPAGGRADAGTHGAGDRVRLFLGVLRVEGEHGDRHAVTTGLICPRDARQREHGQHEQHEELHSTAEHRAGA